MFVQLMNYLILKVGFPILNTQLNETSFRKIVHFLLPIQLSSLSLFMLWKIKVPNLAQIIQYVSLIEGEIMINRYKLTSEY